MKDGGVDDPRRGLTTGSIERAKQIVDEVLELAARRGERNTAITRLALCGATAIAWPIVTFEEMRAGQPALLALEALLVLGCVFSLYMLRRTGRVAATRGQRNVSIFFDCAIVLAFLGAFVAEPPPEYYGVSRISGAGAIYLVVAAAGARLSRRGAQLALAVLVVGLTLLFIADDIANRELAKNTMPSVVSFYVLLGAAGLFAIQNATRTRDLVLEGARQMLLAEKTRERFGAYVSEEIATASLGEDEIRLGGVRQEVAVLFSDLRAFTSASEKTEPEALVAELNEYFEAMVAEVRRYGGVVDKYIGDSIMAVFGAPRPRDDDALAAIKAAQGMQAALERVNEQRMTRGLAPLAHGIGVHRGVVIAGNIGTRERASYTVIGDTVNVAARLESATKDMGVPVLISEAAAKAAGIPLRPVGNVKAKGRDEPIPVFTIVS